MSDQGAWEYVSTFLWAKADKHPDYQDYFEQRWGRGRVPNYAPEALIPDLDAYGAEGWELVHIEPVKVGQRADVMTQAAERIWTNAYFCVFKRPASRGSGA